MLFGLRSILAFHSPTTAGGKRRIDEIFDGLEREASHSVSNRTPASILLGLCIGSVGLASIDHRYDVLFSG